MSKENIIGFSLSEKLSKEDYLKKLDNHIKNYDATVELRQKELEDKLNELVMDFQKKENAMLIVKCNTEEWNIRPVKTMLVVDTERKLFP